MKNKFWDRVLIFLYVILTSALAVIVTLQVFDINLINNLFTNLENAAPGLIYKLIVCGLGAIFVLLGLFVVLAITPRVRRREDFVTLASDEKGHVVIALPALKEMAMQAIGKIGGYENPDVEIIGEPDAISVKIKLDVDASAHVPTVTMNLQRDVRSYIEMNCGVTVRDVTVLINSVIPSVNTTVTPNEEPHESYSGFSFSNDTLKSEENTAISETGAETEDAENAEDTDKAE